MTNLIDLKYFNIKKTQISDVGKWWSDKTWHLTTQDKNKVMVKSSWFIYFAARVGGENKNYFYFYMQYSFRCLRRPQAVLVPLHMRNSSVHLLERGYADSVIAWRPVDLSQCFFVFVPLTILISWSEYLSHLHWHLQDGNSIFKLKTRLTQPRNNQNNTSTISMFIHPLSPTHAGVAVAVNWAQVLMPLPLTAVHFSLFFLSKSQQQRWTEQNGHKRWQQESKWWRMQRES